MTSIRKHRASRSIAEGNSSSTIELGLSLADLDLDFEEEEEESAKEEIEQAHHSAKCMIGIVWMERFAVATMFGRKRMQVNY